MPKPANRSPRLRWLPQALAFLLVFTQLQAVAQQAATPQQPPAPQASPQPAQPIAQLPVERSLQIRVLAGKDEANDLERKIMAPVVVQVVDQNQRPVEGAEVVVRFPLSGPGAAFTGGKASQTIRTNAEGQAAALNWAANNQQGTFQVHVSASYSNQIGETTFSMTNANHVVEEGQRAKRASWWSHRWVKVAVIGGAAAIVAGVVLATRGGSSAGGGGTTVIINPGGPTVGGPH
jgi:hypothetical protein